jgi:hypothetical protein
MISFQFTCFDIGRSLLKYCPDINNILPATSLSKLADSFSTKRRRGCQVDSLDSGQSLMVGFCEHNTLWYSIKAKDYFNQLSNYKLFRENLAP